MKYPAKKIAVAEAKKSAPAIKIFGRFFPKKAAGTATEKIAPIAAGTALRKVSERFSKFEIPKILQIQNAK